MALYVTVFDRRTGFMALLNSFAAAVANLICILLLKIVFAKKSHKLSGFVSLGTFEWIARGLDLVGNVSGLTQAAGFKGNQTIRE